MSTKLRKHAPGLQPGMTLCGRPTSEHVDMNGGGYHVDCNSCAGRLTTRPQLYNYLRSKGFTVNAWRAPQPRRRAA
jgi:hypothetical protein